MVTAKKTVSARAVGRTKAEAIAVREAPEPPVVEVEARPFMFCGREIMTRCPSGEQLLTMIEVLAEIQQVDGTDMSLENLRTLRSLLNRFYGALCTAFVSSDDREWVASARLSGAISLEMPGVLDAPDRLAQLWADRLPGLELNREQKRAASRKK